MPNTLAHLGLQGLATRAILPRSDLKWIALGCVIPDLPWIAQRLVSPFVADATLLDLRLVFLVQASLLFCLVLSGAFSTLAQEPGRVFRILALNSLLHLLLDASQTKMGNGVHFFAPLSWKLTNFSLFWPESPVTVVLTVGGLVWLLYAWWRSPGIPVLLSTRPRRNLLVGAALVLVWLLVPIALIRGPELAANHSVATLRAIDQRAGHEASFDRPGYVRGEEGDALVIFTRESLSIRRGAQAHPGMISVRARFVDENTIDILKAHRHWPRVRDFSSILGLGLISLLWIQRFLREPRRRG